MVQKNKTNKQKLQVSLKWQFNLNADLLIFLLYSLIFLERDVKLILNCGPLAAHFDPK